MNVLWRISYPRSVELGRVPGTNLYVDVSGSENAELITGAVIYRVDGNLFFANATDVREHVVQLAVDQNAELVIMDMSASPRIDISAVEMIIQLKEDLEALGADFRLAELHQDALELLQVAEPEAFQVLVGDNQRISEIVIGWEAQTGDSSPDKA